MILVLAVSSGIAVANLYYNQPLLAVMAQSLHATESSLGLVSALTQAGYGIGMLLLVPLGDTLERKRLIVGMQLAVTAASAAVAAAPGFAWLAGASLILGLTTMTPQLLVPLAAGLAEPERRGTVVGQVMSGLLIGILISRTVSGVIGDWLGWRGMFWIATGLNVILAAALAYLLPNSKPATRLSYPRLLASMLDLFRTEPVLRQSCLFGAASFGGFSAFWTTLAFLLANPPYQYNSATVGLFGLLGAAGALAAPAAGRIADRRSPFLTIGLGLALVLTAFVLFGVFPRSLWILILGVIVLDVGAQGSHISNQARIYSLRPEVHNRLNTVYMVLFFVGGAMGSSLASWAWGRLGWTGACLVGGGMALIGLMGFAVFRFRSSAPKPAEVPG